MVDTKIIVLCLSTKKMVQLFQLLNLTPTQDNMCLQSTNMLMQIVVIIESALDYVTRKRIKENKARKINNKTLTILINFIWHRSCVKFNYHAYSQVLSQAGASPFYELSLLGQVIAIIWRLDRPLVFFITEKRCNH